MKINSNSNNGILNIELEGRLDTKPPPSLTALLLIIITAWAQL